jgi:hypothetical protein
MTELNLATCSYKAFRPEMGVPVRSSCGANRYFRWPIENGSATAPWSIFRHEDRYPTEAVQRDRYLRQLDETADKIRAQLGEIQAKYPGQTLVLLCYEDVHAGKACHRRWFADWIAERFQVEIPEISPAPVSKQAAAASKLIRSPKLF